MDLKSPKETDRFALSSEKTLVAMVASKEFNRTLGEGRIGYVNIGWGSAPPLTDEQRATLPREILGEMVVLSARPGSATALIIYSRKVVIVGDGVKLNRL